MDEYEKFWWCAAIVFAVIIWSLGFWVGEIRVREEAVKKGFAEYNQTSGDWQWKEVRK